MWLVLIPVISGLWVGFSVVGQPGDCAFDAFAGARVIQVTSGLPAGTGVMSCGAAGWLLIAGAILVGFLALRSAARAS